MTEEDHWEQLAADLQAVREYNGRVIGQAFDRAEIHGTKEGK